jgi:hypothetical protein
VPIVKFGDAEPGAMLPRVAFATACTRANDATPADGERPLSDEEMFDALCSERRLYVLRHLREVGGEAPLGALVDAVAAMEYGKRPAELTRDERRRVYVSLYQTHLPKLGDRGLVRWDDDDTVTLLVDDYFPGDRDTGAVWYRYYLAASVGWAVVAASIAVGVGPLTAFDPLVAGSGLVSTSFVLSVVHSLFG